MQSNQKRMMKLVAKLVTSISIFHSVQNKPLIFTLPAEKLTRLAGQYRLPVFLHPSVANAVLNKNKPIPLPTQAIIINTRTAINQPE